MPLSDLAILCLVSSLQNSVANSLASSVAQASNVAEASNVACRLRLKTSAVKWAEKDSGGHGQVIRSLCPAR